MKKSYLLSVLLTCIIASFHSTSYAALLTFDDAISGATTYNFDGDGDNIDDVIFSTTDPLGFNTVGPGPNMTYINEPGLEGTTLINPDLRVDFLNGASGSLRFGFALNDFIETSNTWASFEVYDENDNLLGSDFELGLYTLPDGFNPSSFPEGIIEVMFSGVASYALFDFNNDPSGGQRYILDNFEGTFGSTETIVPIPATVWLFGSGLLGLVGMARRKKA